MTLLELDLVHRGESPLAVMQAIRGLGRGPYAFWQEQDLTLEETRDVLARLREQLGPSSLERLAATAKEEE